MNMSRALFLTFILLPALAFSDSYYAAIKIHCSHESDTLLIENISAYNELGIKESDENQGIYIPDRIWHKKNKAAFFREHKCKTNSASYLVKIGSSFANVSDSDSLEIAVVREGKNILNYTPMDSDKFGSYPGSYIISVTIKKIGDPVFKRSCSIKEHLNRNCSK